MANQKEKGVKVTIGRIVMYRGDARNGETEYPAIVTKVWPDGETDTRNGPAKVSLTAFPPGAPPIYALEEVTLFNAPPNATQWPYVAWAPVIA